MGNTVSRHIEDSVMKSVTEVFKDDALNSFPIRDFSTALFLNVYQLCVLQFPQSVYRLLPPAMEQTYYLTDGVVQINAPVLVSPAILTG